jgi:hypothetical protein
MKDAMLTRRRFSGATVLVAAAIAAPAFDHAAISAARPAREAWNTA